MAQVVGRELGLPAGADAGLRAGHDPGVVDEDVDGAVRGEEPLGEGADAVQVAEVELVHLDTVETGDRLLGDRPAPRRDDDPGTGLGERAGRLQAEPRVAAGDDRQLPREVDAVEHVVRAAPEVESRTDLVLCSGHTADATN